MIPFSFVTPMPGHPSLGLVSPLGQANAGAPSPGFATLLGACSECPAAFVAESALPDISAEFDPCSGRRALPSTDVPVEILSRSLCPSIVPPPIPEPPAAGLPTGEMKKSPAGELGVNIPPPLEPAEASHGAFPAASPVLAPQVQTTPEKTAASFPLAPERGLRTALNARKEKILTIDSHVEEDGLKIVGIGNAKSLAVMPAVLEPTPSSLRSDASVSAVAPVAGPVSELPQSFIGDISADPSAAYLNASVSAEAPEERSIPASDAVGVVREVVELTHEFRARERGSVEVRFHFQNDTEVSVRVACRDGVVHTTFRTDSDELRAALSREWQSQPAGAGDAVFESSPVVSGSASEQQSGSSTGRDARRQSANVFDHSSDRPGASSPRFHSSASATTAGLAALGPRFSRDRLLHAFA